MLGIGENTLHRKRKRHGIGRKHAPWHYDAATDRHWHPGHRHWHQGRPPAR